MMDDSHIEMIEKLFDSKVSAVETHVKSLQSDTEDLKRFTATQIDNLWAHVNTNFTASRQSLSDHILSNSERLHELEAAMVARVPAWAVGIMTIGGSIIGSMATYIITHLK